MSKFDVYQHVTDQIVAKLEEGVIPWRKPWKSTGGGVQRNFNSDRPYRGINQILLSMSEFDSPYWMTAKGVKKAGGTIKESEYYSNGGRGSTIVVFWKIIKKKETDESGQKVERTIPLLRFYKIWNLDQTEGIELEEAGETPDADPILPIEECERVVAEMPQAPTIDHGGDRAYYRPSADHVQMPEMDVFESSEHYYGTLFHELVHSTGHESRLKRPGITDASMFGSESYSDEELVAEMGSAMLCAVTGISPATIDNSASYIKSWLRRLKDDPKLVVFAAQRGQKAADFILGTTFEEEKREED